jgi:hypothetical protein
MELYGFSRSLSHCGDKTPTLTGQTIHQPVEIQTSDMSDLDPRGTKGGISIAQHIFAAYPYNLFRHGLDDEMEYPCCQRILFLIS